MKKPNWFIAFPIEKAELLKDVLINPPADYRFFEAPDIHLTFAFLGPVDREKAYRAWTIAETCTCKPVIVTMGAVAPFGPQERPSAFAFTIEQGSEQLNRCRERWQLKMLEAAGQPPDPWEGNWRPHITIARPPRNADDALRSEGVAWAGQIVPPADAFCLDQLALYTWHDNRPQRQFKIVASRKL